MLALINGNQQETYQALRSLDSLELQDIFDNLKQIYQTIDCTLDEDRKIRVCENVARFFLRRFLTDDFSLESNTKLFIQQYGKWIDLSLIYDLLLLMKDLKNLDLSFTYLIRRNDDNYLIRLLAKKFKMSRKLKDKGTANLLLVEALDLIRCPTIFEAFMRLCRYDQKLNPSMDFLGLIDGSLVAPLRMCAIQAIYAILYLELDCSEFLKYFQENLNYDLVDLRILFHLIMSDDTESYYECLNLTIFKSEYFGGTFMDPKNLNQDLIGDLDYDANIFAKKYIFDTPAASDFVLSCIKLYGIDELGDDLLVFYAKLLACLIDASMNSLNIDSIYGPIIRALSDLLYPE